MEISRSFVKFLSSKKRRHSLEFLQARNYGGYGWFGPRDEYENSSTNVRNDGHDDLSWRNGTKTESGNELILKKGEFEKDGQ